MQEEMEKKTQEHVQTPTPPVESTDGSAAAVKNSNPVDSHAEKILHYSVISPRGPLPPLPSPVWLPTSRSQSNTHSAQRESISDFLSFHRLYL